MTTFPSPFISLCQSARRGLFLLLCFFTVHSSVFSQQTPRIGLLTDPSKKKVNVVPRERQFSNKSFKSVSSFVSKEPRRGSSKPSSSNCYAGDPHRSAKTGVNKIVIEVRFTPEYIKSLPLHHQADVAADSILFRIAPFERIAVRQMWTERNLYVKKNTVKLIVITDKMQTVESPFWRVPKMFCPGDSINFTYTGQGKSWVGKGAEVFSLQDQIEQFDLRIPERWYKGAYSIMSLADYLEWLRFCDDRLEGAMKIVDSYKNRISFSLYKFYKKEYAYVYQYSRGIGFMTLVQKPEAAKNLKPADLIAICDSTLNNGWDKWLQANGKDRMDISYFYQINRIQAWKKYGFDLENDSLNTAAKRRILYYNTLKKNYTGLVRERLLQYVLTEEVMKELGYNHPLTTALLKDYYRQPGFPQYKKWMKEFEKKAAKLYPGNIDAGDRSAPVFQLTDTKGSTFTNKDIKGKLALLDFWFSGCTGCVQMTPVLQKVENTFAADTLIAFMNVSTDTDKNRWLKSIEHKKYTTGSGLNLYTGGKGTRHSMVEEYNIYEYPELYIIDAWGQIHYPVPDPRKDSGLALISLLNKLRATMNDGPYVLYKGDTTQVRYIHTRTRTLDSMVAWSIGKPDPVTFSVATDEFPRTFNVIVKPYLQVEPVEYSQPEKLLVLSDIEGNFDVFRKLLQKNGVIDSGFNWTFGQGHLVLVGDMMDRGEQVIECLWLIYALEEKAKQAGGYVHFILGNHEILNMSGDLRYVQEKYKTTAKLLRESYKDLFGESSELGRWLRTKNIIEKIGNLLFTHGGIARQVNSMPLTLQQINDLIRPHYAERDIFKSNKKNPELMVLFSGSVSPFWYRQYYEGGGQDNIIDSSLQKFGVDRIITGHTIVSDSISIHFGGKIINTDVHHALGKSEALLVEGDKYYRVNINGEKLPLRLSADTRSVSLKVIPFRAPE